MMKKTLIALAAVGACGAAVAQSSVTLYGIADAGVGRIKPGKTEFTGGNTLVNNTPSRIGLKGVEDLGGGNVAGFTFEAGLSLDDGSNVEFDGSPFGASSGRFWDRDANVFFGGGWGTVKLGRQVTPTHIAEFAYDLTGLANYSVVRNSYAAIGMGPWADSAFAYITPNMSGLQAAVAFVSKNDTGLRKNAWDLGVWYHNGPIAAGLSVNKGLDHGKTNYQLGAKYDFGNFALAASYHNATTDGVALPHGMDALGRAVELRRRGFSIGGQAKFGAFSVVLDVARDTKNEWGAKKYTNALLEGKYSLSKRTFFYGDVLRLDGQTHWGLGIQHNF